MDEDTWDWHAQFQLPCKRLQLFQANLKETGSFPDGRGWGIYKDRLGQKIFNFQGWACEIGW